MAWHLTRTVVGPVRRLTRGRECDPRGTVLRAHRCGVARRARRAGGGVQSDGRRSCPSSGARTSARSSGPRTRSKRRWRPCRTPSSCSMPQGTIQSMNRAAVRALASAGVHEPRRLDDLRLDGLDLHAVTRGDRHRRWCGSASRPDAHDSRRTGRRGPAAAAACRAGSSAESRNSEAPCCCCTT